MTVRTLEMVRTTTVLLLAATLGACNNAPPAADAGAQAQPAEASKAAPAEADVNAQLTQLRELTARFQQIDDAKAAGYAQITPCWTSPADGAMGVHYGNSALIGDNEIALERPEALIYEPQTGGGLKLVGLEYIAPDSAWFASHGGPPELLGQTFMAFAPLKVQKLHVWLYRDNPKGMFADWNPAVSCANAAETDTIR